MSDSQWTVKVKIGVLDAGSMNKKSKWEAGDNLTVSIEPHATVNMLKQRIALIVQAHTKHQILKFPVDVPLDDIVKLQDIEGLANGATLFVDLKIPPMEKAPPVVLSDDEGLFAGEEAEAPAMPEKEVIEKELSDADMDKQGDLKQQAQEAFEDGDLSKAVEKQTDALLLGNISAMMISKRGEILLKQKRYRASIADASLALELNPDSAKAYRVRGKARRFIGEYEGSSADFAQAQTIDYDEGVADMHSYVQKRWARIQLKAKQDAEADA